MRGMAGVPLRRRAVSVGRTQAIRDPQQRQRMRLACMRWRLALLDSLQDRAAGDRTVGTDVIGLVLSHLPEHWPADFHRCIEMLCLDAPRAVMPRASLHG